MCSDSQWNMGHTVVGTLQALSLGATVVYKITVILYKKTIFFFFLVFWYYYFFVQENQKKHKRFCVLTGITGVYKRTRDPFLCSSPLRDPLFLGGWRNTVLSEVVCQHRYVLSKCPLREGPRYQPWGKVRGQIIFFAWDFQTLVSLCPIASCP